MPADPHDLIPAVLREFGGPKFDIAQHAFETASALNRATLIGYQAAQDMANLEKPTRAELLIEVEKLRALLVAARSYNGDAILTDYTPQPIPERNGDWSAHRHDYEPGQPLGHGSTELAAVTSLLEQEDERDE